MVEESITIVDLEKAAENVKLDTIYDDFFSNNGYSKFNTDCNVFDSGDEKNEDAKEICLKLAHLLEEIAKIKDTSQRYDYCNYLTYWFYDEIGKILKDHSKNVRDVSFVKALIDVEKKFNKKNTRKYYCSLKPQESINVNEWKKRKLLYIYFRKHNHIKYTISKDQDKCNYYLKYLNNINSLYTKYYKENCEVWFRLLTPNYIVCDKKFHPNILINTIGECNVQVPRSNSGSLWGFFDILSPLRSSGSKKAIQEKSTPDAEDAKTKPEVPEKVDGVEPPGNFTELTDATNDNEVKSETVKDQAQPGRNGESPPVEVHPLPLEVNEEPAYVEQYIPILYIPNEETYATDATLSEVSNNSFDFSKKLYESLKFLDFRKSVAAGTVIAALIFLIFFFSSARSGGRTNRKIKKEKKYKNDVNSDSEEILSKNKSKNPHYIQDSSSIYLSYNS